MLLMSECTYKSMTSQPKLSQSDTQTNAYGADAKVTLLGKYQATVETERKLTTSPFYVTQGKSGNILIYDFY